MGPEYETLAKGLLVGIIKSCEAAAESDSFKHDAASGMACCKLKLPRGFVKRALKGKLAA